MYALDSSDDDKYNYNNNEQDLITTADHASYPSLFDCPEGMGVALIFFVIFTVLIVWLLVRTDAMDP